MNVVKECWTIGHCAGDKGSESTRVPNPVVIPPNGSVCFPALIFEQLAALLAHYKPN